MASLTTTQVTRITVPVAPAKQEPPGRHRASGRFFYLPINALSLGHLAGSQNLLECVLVQHGYAQLLGFGELGARFGAGD